MWTYNNYLAHHGVTGMKWKVHKAKNLTLEVDDKKSKKKVNSKKSEKESKKDTKKSTVDKKEKNNSKIVEQVINGKFGNGQVRVKSLKKAGYNYDKIQNLVNEKLLGKAAAKRIAKRRAKRSK